MPTWLRPGSVYVKRHVRSKGDLLAHDAELLEANPQYTHVRFNNIRKTAVSLRDFIRKTAVSLRDFARHPQQVNWDCSDPTEMSTESTKARDCA